MLKHPWVTEAAPDVHLGDSYITRIKHLALRQNMRKFFLNNDLSEKNRIRMDHVKGILRSAKDKYKISSATKRMSFSIPQDFSTKRSGNGPIAGVPVEISPLHGRCSVDSTSSCLTPPSRASSVASESGDPSLRRWTRYSQGTYDNKMNTFKDLMINLINYVSTLLKEVSICLLSNSCGHIIVQYNRRTTLIQMEVILQQLHFVQDVGWSTMVLLRS